jgi:methylated-DNA-[protein]-cysteine S-methyltransferase
MAAATDERDVLRALWFDDDAAAEAAQVLRRPYGDVALRAGTVPGEIRDALAGYFSGDLAALDAIRWEVAGTPFQWAVWSALTMIPAGATTSYGALAASIGRPAAVRAVGAANGANPIAIVIPCHRLLGARRALTGYGGGLERKRWLLAHEGALPPPALTRPNAED